MNILDDINGMFEKHRLWLDSYQLYGEQLNLRHCEELTNYDFSNRDLRSAKFEHCNLCNATFTNSNLGNALFYYCNLSHANFVSSNLSCTTMCGCDVSKTYFRYSIHDCTDIDGRNFVTLSGIGSSRRQTLYDLDRDIVQCGCFVGSITKFEEAISNRHGIDTKHYAEYRAALTYLKRLKELHDANA